MNFTLNLMILMSKISSLQIQTNKQKISKLKSNNDQFQDNRMPEESSLIRANSRWTKDEVALARIGFVKYGNNPKVRIDAERKLNANTKY